MMEKLAVVVVHGIGAGRGKDRYGFSEKLKAKVSGLVGDVDCLWEEAPWESVNDDVDDRIQQVIKEKFKEIIDEADKKRINELPQLTADTCGRANLWRRIIRRLHIAWLCCWPKLCRILGRAVPTMTDALVDLPFYLNKHAGGKIRDIVHCHMDKALDHSPAGVILVGHSLGSVIAFDVLADELGHNNPHQIRALVTFGSPLNWLRKVCDMQDGSRRISNEIKEGKLQWFNFYDQMDWVSLRNGLDTTYFCGVQNKCVQTSKCIFFAHTMYWQDEIVARCIAELIIGHRR